VLLYEELTNKIINAAIEVHITLGSGFLEKVYENSMILELISRDLSVDQQKPVKVFYKNLEVGNYIADIIVENKVVIELKSVKVLDPIFAAQLLNYLKAFKLPLGLLINFGSSKIEIKRIINTDQIKQESL
jgi:GxxExxY protein